MRHAQLAMCAPRPRGSTFAAIAYAIQHHSNNSFSTIERRIALQPARSRWSPAWWRCRSRSWSHVRPGELGTLKHESLPEGKTVKNRLHLDLRPADQAAEVARLEALGARRVSIGQGGVGWVVMADPDGNEFDVLQPLTPDELPPGHDSLGRRI